MSSSIRDLILADVPEDGSAIGNMALVVTCSPDCYQSEVESGSFMMVGWGNGNLSGGMPPDRFAGFLGGGCMA